MSFPNNPKESSESISTAVARGRSAVGVGTAGDRAVAKERVETDVVTRVKREAVAHPAAPAIVDGEVALNYGDLDRRSSELAHKLRLAGVVKDSVVGVYGDRSIGTVVAALAAMRAGAAYLPLDPSHPKERIGFQIADARAHVVLSVVEEKSVEIRDLAEHMLPIGRDGGPIERSSDKSALDGLLSESDAAGELAYVIYTSGSTGRPKGVEITHPNLTNMMDWYIRMLEVTPEDRISHVAAPGFDATVWELWPALVAGASVVVADSAPIKEPRKLHEWLLSRGITISFIPTPMAEKLMTMPWPARTKLRVMMTGGDTLHFYPPAGLPFQVVNNYGPTECTICATSTFLASGNSSEQLPPIGRPVDNTQVFIVDEALRPVPSGTEGEILIGGRGVGRGYRNRPDLTAEKFIANTIESSLGPRLYRTGDRGCYLPDGQIAFKGRVDDQIKIRGVRMEPAEIEAALGEHPGVRESAVVAREGGHGEKRLVAYLTIHSSSEIDVHDLRSFLVKRLPGPMIPSLFVRVEELPLNASGKINRRALPAPNHGNTLQMGRGTAPRGALEERLTQIWERVLGVRNIGVQQDFFELGGDSLLAVRLIAEVENGIGCRLPISALLEVRTIEELARAIRENAGTEWSSMVAVQTMGLKTPLFCVHSHTGDVLYCEYIARGAGPDQPIYGLQSQGVTGKSPHLSVEEMSDHYVTELRKIQPSGPYQLFGFCFGGIVAFDMARRLTEIGERVAFLGFYNSPAPGTLKRWPLGQFTYLRRRTIDEWRKLWAAEPNKRFTLLLRNLRNFRLMVERTAAIEASESMLQIRGSKRELERLNLEAINIAAAKRFEPGYVHDGQITLFLSPDTAGVYPTPPAEGWSKFSTKQLEIVNVIVDTKGWRGAPFVKTVGGRVAQLSPSIAEAAEIRSPS